MDISVIVPIYGVEKYIEKCLRSLFNQTKTDNVEFILVNDCTKDKSMEIVDKVISEYSNLNITVVNHNENKGLAQTRQTGLDLANGEYCIHIDSDDWCEPTMLEELYSKAKEDQADIVVCDIIWSYTNKDIYSKQAIGASKIETIRMLLKGQTHGAIWNKLVRLSVYRDNSIRNIQGLNYWEDLVCSIKLVSNTDKITYLNKAFLHYVQQEGSLMHNQTAKTTLNIADAICEIDKYLSGKFGDLFYDEITKKKIDLKHFALRVYRGIDQALLSNIFPEITNYIWDYNLPLRHKIAFYAGSKGQLKISNIIYRLSEYIYRLKS